ncbi:hypothetical protein PO909_004781 [Leuciscus waleckii]
MSLSPSLLLSFLLRCVPWLRYGQATPLISVSPDMLSLWLEVKICYWCSQSRACIFTLEGILCHDLDVRRKRERDGERERDEQGRLRTHASFTIFSGPGPFLLNYADNGSPLVSRPAVGAYGLLRELQTGTATPFTICALSYTHSGTLLYHLLLDLSLMSDCQSQSLSSSPPFLSGGMKYFGPLRQLGRKPNIVRTSGHFWLPRLCRVSMVLGIGVTFLKTDGQPGHHDQEETKQRRKPGSKCHFSHRPVFSTDGLSNSGDRVILNAELDIVLELNSRQCLTGPPAGPLLQHSSQERRSQVDLQ